MGLPPLGNPGLDQALLNFVRRIFGLCVGLRLWVALCVSALAMFCERCVSGLPEQEELFFTPSARIVFAATVTLYNLDAALDPDDHGATTLPARCSWLMALGASMWLSLELSAVPGHIALLVGSGAIPCVLYPLRFAPRGRQFHLKAIPGFKAPFVGGAVGLATLLVPLSVHGALARGVRSPSIWLLGAALICYCTTNANLFDLPDTSEDRARHVLSAPVVWGPEAARIQSLLWTLAGAACSSLTPASVRWPLLGLAVALSLAHFVVGTHSRKSSLTLWVDGSLMLPLILRTILP